VLAEIGPERRGHLPRLVVEQAGDDQRPRGELKQARHLQEQPPLQVRDDHVGPRRGLASQVEAGHVVQHHGVVAGVPLGRGHGGAVRVQGRDRLEAELRRGDRQDP